MSIRLTPSPTYKQQEKAFMSYRKLLLNDINKGMSQMVRVTRDHARSSIRNGPRTGRIYSFKGKPHQASRGGPDGEYPKGRTHKLERSIRSYTGRRFIKDVGSSLNYADFLQTGTSKMAERRWLDRAWNESEDKHNRILSRIMAGRTIGLKRERL